MKKTEIILRPLLDMFSLHSSILPMITLLLATASGCSGENHPATYPASGTVKLKDGTPIAGGRIVFQLEDGLNVPSANARIGPDGAFRLGTYVEGDGALQGKHLVLIKPPNPPKDRRWEENLSSRNKSRAPEIIPLHPRYFSFDTSGLTFTVTREPSKNHFDIVLERLQ